MYKLILSIFLLSPVFLLQAQTGHETGYPSVKNYTAADYHAHAQNFAITSDKDGMLYAGNFAGVLQFDGERWRLIPTANGTKVSALATAADGTIYVGARGEAGFLQTSPNGATVYQSLPFDTAFPQPVFGEIISILNLGETMFFVSAKGIISYENHQTAFWESEFTILSAFAFNDRILLQIKEKGLCWWENNLLQPLGGAAVVSQADVITALIALDATNALLAGSSSGLMLFDGRGISVPDLPVQKLLNENPVSCALKLSDGNIALGTTRKGVVVINPALQLVQLIDKEASMQNSFVRALHATTENSFYAALNNGISLVESPAALNFFNTNSGLEGGVKDLLRFKGQLYAATFQGLFVYEAGTFRFRALPQITTAVWDLQLANENLFAAGSGGLFILEEELPKRIFGAFTLSLASNESGSILYAGTTNGLFILKKQGKDWVSQQLAGPDDEVNRLLCDADGTLWGLSAGRGLFSFDAGADSVVFYTAESGLPMLAGLTLNFDGSQMLVGSPAGVFRFDRLSKKFVSAPLTVSAGEADKEWLSLIVADGNGKLWLTNGNETRAAVYERNNDRWQQASKAMLPVSDAVVWTIFPENEQSVWLGGPDGLIHFNSKRENKSYKPQKVQLRKIIFGNDKVYREGEVADSLVHLAINHADNSLRLEFALPFHAARRGVEYQYFLDGFDENWSEWNPLAHKEYTNLPGGNYNFRLRARTVYGDITDENHLRFHVRSPWYAMWWAVLIYVLLAAFIVWLIVVVRNRSLMKEKKILEERIASRTAEVVQQKEEIELQSRELADKNEELEKINTAIKYINAEVQLDNLLQSLLDKLRIIKAAEKSVALLPDNDGSAFRYKAAIGYDMEDIGGLRLSLAEAESRYLSQADEVFEDLFIKTDFSSLELTETLQRFAKPRSMMVLVIRIENRVEAFLIFENFSREKAFGQRDLSLMRNAKEHIISAIIRTRILDDLQQTLHNLRDTQEQLIQSEKLASLGQLTAGIAHEIQNPLNFVNNFASLSADLSNELLEILQSTKTQIPAETFEEADEVIGMIRSNVIKINEHGKRVESIVKGMLQHSRGKTGEFEDVDVNSMVEEYVSLAYHGMKAKDKSFNTALTSRLDPLVGKAAIIPQDLSRVILNITNNACYAVDERAKKNVPGYKPEVVISTRKAGDKVVISIRDNGTGIPPHVIEKIFNPFFTTKPTGKGTGLGLSMSFDIVSKLHKGKLEVRSEEGEFTEFVITIPEKQPKG